ncbi:transcriptional regulator, PadR-like family [Beutenbergia cavernae DSM 12333]|uniref:Transcriptional regulator, PadR-like family n=1 Tax=Beutenbergia cavernae (strain ATCC BAA-8 / DSM 12333 / CCUG 43141 / JCM 11478 / NBRC 16432 / NCIMB 13614 / HKI 0122) TaxID=471853 RepID=C5C5Y5_BEUC1|nr:PadR family transcriptional regulator [Beutenbergia cavernae]ACQ82343.1 transcriptional regulator, PadR-like family [Beutenbergia cavernae DSM 12333]
MNHRHFTRPDSQAPEASEFDTAFDAGRRGPRPGGPRRRRGGFAGPEDSPDGGRGRRRGGRGPFAEGDVPEGGRGRRGGRSPFDEGFGGAEFHRHPHGPGGRGRGRGGRAGRGDVRAAVLLLLHEEPMHGYQLMQEIAERSGGSWRPSPGAIYPALNLLADEGLVELSAEGGRRLASLTDAGRAHVTEHADALGNPWADGAGRGPSAHRQLREAIETVGVAAHQVARTGSPDQVAASLAALEAARRELYLILAGEASSASAGEEPGHADGSDAAPSGS